MLYFPKFEAAKVLFPKCLKYSGSHFRKVENLNVFQISEVEYVTVISIVSNNWNM